MAASRSRAFSRRLWRTLKKRWKKNIQLIRIGIQIGSGTESAARQCSTAASRSRAFSRRLWRT